MIGAWLLVLMLFSTPSWPDQQQEEVFITPPVFQSRQECEMAGQVFSNFASRFYPEVHFKCASMAANGESI